MTDRELREIKRRFRPDKGNISRIVGCFVNTNKEILYRINQPLGLEDSVVSEKLLSVMRKVLTGGQGTAINSVEFTTREVSESAEHKLLMDLRASGLRDASLLESFYSAVAESVELDNNYAILLAYDVYDVPERSSDGESVDSTKQFSYVVCAICPVKEAPEALTFREADSLFHSSSSAGILAAPELGFMFPAFDGRATNIYGASYYTRSKSTAYGDFTRRLFGKEPPMPPAHQKAAFADGLSSALCEECDLALVRSLHGIVGEMVEAHKESRDPEPLTITRHTACEMLTNLGVEEEKIEKFGATMDEHFGKGTAISPKNVISHNRFEVKMPDVKITVSPEYRDYISTREIGGERYITIKVTGPVEINGISVSLDKDKDATED